MESWYRIQAALLAAVVCIALGLAVMLRGRRRDEALGYGALALSLAGWFIVDAVRLGELLEPVPAAALRALSLAALGWTLVGFFYAFLGEGDGRALAALVTTRVLAALCFASAVLLWIAETLFRSTEDQEAALDGLTAFELGVAALSLAASVSLMFGHAARVALRSERARLLSLAYASAGVFSLAFLSYGLEVGVAWLGNLLPAVFLFFIYQVLSLRRILDVYEFVGRMAILAAFALIISAIYALIVGWWRHDFGLFLFNSAIASMVILILLDPLRAVVETRLAELVFRERFEFTKEAEAIGRALANVIDIGAMSDLLMRRLEASRLVTHASVYLRDEEGLRFERLGFVGTAPPETLDAIASRPFLARLLQNRVVALDQLEAEIQALAESEALEGERQREALAALVADMRHLEAQVVVGFESAGQLLGLIALQNERLREAWATEELRAIVALAGQATRIVENSRLFDRIRERDRLAAVGQMAAGLAHEIRNPLGAIKGAAQLLAEVDPDQRAVFLGIIHEEVERLDGVVSQFLTYARPLRTRREPVAVNQVVERTLTLLSADPHASTVTFTPGENLPQLRSDPELLRQMTLNLSRNAIEAMAPQGGGRLALSTAVCWRSPTDREHPQSRIAGHVEGGSYVRLRFEDEGPGIAPEVMERLFIPFYTTKSHGTGLGLAICQRIVESLGGFIEVVSRAGHGPAGPDGPRASGATMSVYLPVQESGAARSAGTLPPPA